MLNENRMSDTLAEDDSAPLGEVVGEAEFHYQKGNLFRVVHADGVYGGITPSGLIHFAVYSERAAIPKRTKLTIRAGENRPGVETTMETIGGFVRELDVDVVMDVQTAAAFYGWLKQKVEILRDRLEIAPEDWDEMTRMPR